MDLASVVAALASVGVRVSGSTPNNNIQGDSSRACPTGLAGPEPSGTHNHPGQHFQGAPPSGGTAAQCGQRQLGLLPRTHTGVPGQRARRSRKEAAPHMTLP